MLALRFTRVHYGKRWVWRLLSFASKAFSNPGLMQVTVAKPITYVAEPEKFWSWLRQEENLNLFLKKWRSAISCETCFEVPLTREEKRQRQQR